MPSVRASCCPLPLATPSGECVNHQSSVTLLCLDYKWGLFGIIKQICHASGGNMMECFPSGGWFSPGLRPRENHPPSGKHSIMLPPLAWHICIITTFIQPALLPPPTNGNTWPLINTAKSRWFALPLVIGITQISLLKNVKKIVKNLCH